MVYIRKFNIAQPDFEGNRCDGPDGGQAGPSTAVSAEGERDFTIMLVGANSLYKKALKFVLDEQSRSQKGTPFSVQDSSTVENFAVDLSRLPEPHRRSLIILLLDEGGEPASTIKQIELIRRTSEDLKIILISSSKNEDYIFRCVKKGIHAYVLSDLSEQKLVDCACLVAHGQTVFPARTIQHIVRSASPQPHVESNGTDQALLLASDRGEALILACLASGMPNKAISRVTGLSDPSTKLAVRKILAKIGAKNRVQAAVWAQKNGYALDP